MPMEKNNMKGLSKMSSGMTGASSVSLNRYVDEAEKLDWSVQYLSDKHVKMYETCNKYKQEQCQAHFDHIASNYEGMYLRMGYPDPAYVSKLVTKMSKVEKKAPQDIKVLDFACGTGLVGKNLSEQGFTNIVGLDVSPNMLEEASNKGVYSELHEHTLGNAADFPAQFKNKFDVVTATGLINNNHMDYQIFEEMILSLKKGGYAVFAARFSYMGHYWYDEIIKELQKEGRWNLVASETFFKYDQLDEVSIGRFSKTPCKVFVFQKTQDELPTHIDK